MKLKHSSCPLRHGHDVVNCNDICEWFVEGGCVMRFLSLLDNK